MNPIRSPFTINHQRKTKQHHEFEKNYYYFIRSHHDDHYRDVSVRQPTAMNLLVGCPFNRIPQGGGCPRFEILSIHCRKFTWFGNKSIHFIIPTPHNGLIKGFSLTNEIWVGEANSINCLYLLKKWMIISHSCRQ